MVSEFTEDDKSWEHVLYHMLPTDALLLEEEHLDYSIVVEYEGPLVPYDVSKANPLEIGAATDGAAVLIRMASIVSDHNAVASILVTMYVHQWFSRLDCR